MAKKVVPSSLEEALASVDPERRKFLGLMLTGAAALPLLTTADLAAQQATNGQTANTQSDKTIKMQNGQTIKAPNGQTIKTPNSEFKFWHKGEGEVYHKGETEPYHKGATDLSHKGSTEIKLPSTQIKGENPNTTPAIRNGQAPGQNSSTPK